VYAVYLRSPRRRCWYCLYRPRPSPAPLPICLSYVSACLICPSDLCLGVLKKVRGIRRTSNVCIHSAEMPHGTRAHFARMRMKEGSGDPTPAKRTVPRSFFQQACLYSSLSCILSLSICDSEEVACVKIILRERQTMHFFPLDNRSQSLHNSFASCVRAHIFLGRRRDLHRFTRI